MVAGRRVHGIRHADLAVRQHPQLGRGEHHVEPAARGPRRVGRPVRRHQPQPVGHVDEPPGTAGVVLVQVAGQHERPAVGDRSRIRSVWRDPLGRLEAQVHRHGRQLAAAGQRDPHDGVPPGAVRPAHRQPQVLGPDDAHPVGRQHRGAAAPPVPAGPAQAAGGGEPLDPPPAEQPSGHLLQAEHVGVDGAHDPGREVVVVEEVAGVVARDAHRRHGRAQPETASVRARSAAPTSPASLPSWAATIARLGPVATAGELAAERLAGRVEQQVAGGADPAPDDERARVERRRQVGHADAEPAADLGEQLAGQLVAVAGGLGDQRAGEVLGPPLDRGRTGRTPPGCRPTSARGPHARARCRRRTAPSSPCCRTRSGCRRAPPACARTRRRCRSARG